MRIVLDCESNLAHTKIWLVCTKNIDTGEKRTWKEASSLMDYLRGVSLIVGHNVIGFDSPLLKKCWKIEIASSLLYDTLIVSRLLEPSRENGHSLEAWGNSLGCQKINYQAAWQWVMGRREEYELECYDKPHMGLLESYCEQDCKVTAKLYLNLVNELNEKQFSEQSVALEHEVAFIIEEQIENGFKLDRPYATTLITHLKTRVDELLEQSEALYPTREVERYSDKTGKRLKDAVVTFNISSRQQVAKKLQELGWRPSKYTEKGSIIVDEVVLDEIIKECNGLN
jgi:DNA polymerase-1